MRALLLVAAGAFALSLISASGMAADLAVPKQQVEMPTKAPVAERACLRWVEQNYSWYNYCDPVPYYPRKYAYHWVGLF